MIECIPYSNLSICNMGFVDRTMHRLNSQTPLGIRLWTLMLIGVVGIAIYCFMLFKLGFFDEKENKQKPKEVLEK